MKKPRNRAAQDATLINIRSLKGRVAFLERLYLKLDRRIDRLEGKRTR